METWKPIPELPHIQFSNLGRCYHPTKKRGDKYVNRNKSNNYVLCLGARGDIVTSWPLPAPKHLSNVIQCDQHYYGLMDAIGNCSYRLLRK